MKKSNNSFFAIFICSIFAFSCSEGEQKNEAKELSEKAEKHVQEKKEASTPLEVQKVKSLTHSIPSPIEVAHIIKASGGNYAKSNLNPAKRASQYPTRFQQSLNLGVYSADLTLASMYNQHQDALTYLGSINEISNALEIDHLFDLEAIEKLLKNNDNLDSLLTISTSNFEKINLYLHSQNRSHQTTLILTGGWIEGLYLLCQIQKEISSDELSEKIGEQKFVLEQLLKLLNTYSSEEDFKSLHHDLKKLHSIYEGVIIETTQGKAEHKETNGMMLISSNAIQSVQIPDEVLKEISVQLNQIRNNIIDL